jgi:hypothetical protein
MIEATHKAYGVKTPKEALDAVRSRLNLREQVKGWHGQFISIENASLHGNFIREVGQMARDIYTNNRALVVGKNNQLEHITSTQIFDVKEENLSQLAQALNVLRQRMKQEPGGVLQDVAIGHIAAAEEAANNSDKSTMLTHLKSAGRWALSVAEKIGVDAAAEVLKKALDI